jgi:hypothetical protein
MNLLIPSRRSFLLGLGAALAAPAIVRASSLMPISAKLITPEKEFVGKIKPNVGPIPDGWIECNGRWLCKRAHHDLYRVIGGKYGENGTTFNVPDMRNQAELDRSNNKIVGRYVIYGGSQQSTHKQSIDAITGMTDWRQQPTMTIDDNRFAGIPRLTEYAS